MNKPFNQIQLEDISDLPVTSIEGTRGSSPFSYKLKNVTSERIDKEFWFLERRAKYGNYGTFHWSITKLRILYVVEAHGKKAIDAIRFVKGSGWIRQIYPFDTLNGFQTEDEQASRLFKDEKSVTSFALKAKLVGLEITDLSEAIVDPPSQKLIHRKPIFEKLGNDISLDHYIDHLGTKFNWQRGVIVGVERGELIRKLVNLTTMNFLIVDPYVRDIDHFGMSLSMFSKNELASHLQVLSEIQSSMPKRLTLCRKKTEEMIQDVPDESFDFVYFRHTAKSSSPGVRYEINSWLPKIKPDGWLLGNGIDRSLIHDVVDEILPDWHLGHLNTWVRSKNGN